MNECVFKFAEAYAAEQVRQANDITAAVHKQLCDALRLVAELRQERDALRKELDARTNSN